MNDYPINWQDLRWQFYESANYRCEHCGMEFKQGTTTAKTATRRDGKPFVLTVHHLNGDKSDCRYKNCVAMCQRCHLHVQAIWTPPAIPEQWIQDGFPVWYIERGYKVPEMVQLGLFE